MSKPAIISTVRSCYRENKTENDSDQVKDYLSLTNSNTLRRALVGEKVKLQSAETSDVSQQGNPVIDILPQSALSGNEIVKEILEIEASLQKNSPEVTSLNREVIECTNAEFEAHNDRESGERAEESRHPEDAVDRDKEFTETDCEKMLLSLQTDPKKNTGVLVAKIAYGIPRYD